MANIKPVCIGAPERGFASHAPVAMYKSGTVWSGSKKLARWRCPRCGRTTSGAGATRLMTQLVTKSPSISKTTKSKPKRTSRRRSRGWSLDTRI